MFTRTLQGVAQFSGTWDTITSARSFDPDLLTIPANSAYWTRFITGSVANLTEGESLSGGTSSSTVRLLKQIIEQGAAGATTGAGILLLTNTKSAAFSGEVLTGAVSSGTVVIPGDLLPINFPGMSISTILIEVEAASINFTIDGTTPTVTAGTNQGMTLTAGTFYTIDQEHLRSFKCINAVNASGAKVKYSLLV
jgi:hypothetical protein